MKSKKKTMQRLNALVTETLLVTCVVLLGVAGIIAFAIRLTGLPNLAEHLPADTEAYIVLDLVDVTQTLPDPNAKSWEILGSPVQELEWIGQYGAMALIDGETVYMLSTRDKAAAKTFFEEMDILPEPLEVDTLASEPIEEPDSKEILTTQIQTDYPEMTCLQVHPMCYRLSGKLLFWSDSADALAQIDSTESLETEAFYQNAKNRLPRLVDGFFYLPSESARTWLHQNTQAQSWLMLNFMWDLFPGIAGTVEMEEDKWVIEHFIAVDKSELRGEAFYRPTENFDADLLRHVMMADAKIEWSGQNLNEQVDRILEILSQKTATTSFVVESFLSPWKDSLNLFQDEFYLAIDEDDTWLLALELNSALTAEDQDEALVSLLTQLSNDFSYSNIYTLENGEVQAEWLPMMAEQDEHEGFKYTKLMAGENLALNYAELDDHILIGTWEDGFQSTLLALNSGTEMRTLEPYEFALLTADEWLRIDLAQLADLFEDAYILQMDELVSTRKLFDDGMYTRSILHFKMPEAHEQELAPNASEQ